GAALTTGNLADDRAWWVWAPMGVFAVVLVGIAALHGPRLRGLSLVVAGCLAAGVGTLTMIDKYVMTFSGVIGLLAGGALFEMRRRHPRIFAVTAAVLAAAWLGCYVNLVRGSHWSSQRWLDPFEPVMTQLAADAAPHDAVIATHPSVRYYWGLHQAVAASAESDPNRIPAWRRAAARVRTITDGSAGALASELIADTDIRRIFLIETAAPASAAEAMVELKRRLDSDFVVTDRRRFAHDASARKKTRLDPAFYHPNYRIVMYRFERKN
ncbi:MAG: hypothetical protein V3T70_04070, partial [Phycisphaerae bacterium]